MERVDVVILGAGFSGLSAAIELSRRGRDSFVLLEKAGDVGGTWRDNTYPGVECDVPSHLYSLSSAPNPHWSKTYATGAEIHEYQRECARRFGLVERLRLGVRAEHARWVDNRWHVVASDGRSYEGRFLIAGLGGLHTPNIPEIDGADSFGGAMFHTSRWAHDVSLEGKRVGMIGTGATAVQAAPHVADVAAEFHLFQRSPIWCGSKRDEPYSAAARQAFEANASELQRHRWNLWNTWEATGADLFHEGTETNRLAELDARRNITDNVRDPELVRLLTPTYNFTCKRPTFSNRYYPMFNRPNVHLETSPILRVTPNGIELADRIVDLDVIILATGFQPFDITTAIDIAGLDGVALQDAWSERITSYRSVMVHGFPNLFLLLGPNSAGLTSALQMIEAGARFAGEVMDFADQHGFGAVHPTRRGVDEFTSLVDALTARSTTNQGCSSWWTHSGTNHSLWPDSSLRFRMMLSSVDSNDLIPVGNPAS
jgi:cation diffusion facilitator CzcD-associated flavoprotein CzcO